jgi:Tetratricopeptide repeat
MPEEGKTAGVVFVADDLGAVMPGKPVRLPPRPVLLAGRDDLLATLDIRLTRGNGAGPQIVALHGLAGGGKASVAVEYAHRHLGEVRVAWRFPAEDATVLAAGFTDLAGQLGIAGAAGGSDPVASVHSALAEYPAGWLLVFDNVPGPEQVQEFLPPAGNGRVLITSRNALWPPSETVEVPVLDVDAAAGFLVDRAGDPDERAARALAEDLGGLPLALEQAAAYTRASGGSLAGYLALFQQRRGDILARGEPSGYPVTVATTWALALARLEQTAPAAAGLLRLLAYCAPEAIPLQLLLQPQSGLTDDLAPAVAEALAPLLEDEPTAGDAVAALREHSLVRPAGFGGVSVHRLVQAVTADQMPAELARAWRQAAAALVEAAHPEDPQDPADWPAFAALLPHARAVLDLTSDGTWQIAAYLGHSGSHPAARDLFRQIAGAYHEDDVFGPDHPDTLAARHELAHWAGEAGDAAGARDQFAALLPVIERVFGPVHPDTLTTRSNLATWTGEAGDAAGARDQFAALLPIEERVSGPEHPNTLATRRKLAHWTGQARDAAATRDQNATLPPTDEPVPGPEHPGTLATRSNLAGQAGEAGDAAGARDQNAALLPTNEPVPGPEHPATLPPIDEPVPGPEHPGTLTIRSNLAGQAGEAGDAAGARDQYAALLPVLEKVSGPEHPDTLAARHELAHWTGEAGDAAGARDHVAALFPVIERVLGPMHPDTLAARHGLAHWTGRAGDAAGARHQYAILLPIAKWVYGSEHPRTLAAQHELAHWTGEAGDAAGARDQYAALLLIEARVYGPEHPDTLTTLSNLAAWAGEAGDAAGARDKFAALLPVLEWVSGPEHPGTLAARHNLAHWTGQAGDAAGARHQYATAVPMIERVLGPDHPQTLTTRSDLTYWTQEAAGGLDPEAD